MIAVDSDLVVPACWHFDHPFPDEAPDSDPTFARDFPEAAARIAAEPLMIAVRRDVRERLRAWQFNRCAICFREEFLVEDHEHSSGLTRGYLCQRCNVGEGVNAHQLYSLYRWRHPTSILGLRIRYVSVVTGVDYGTDFGGFDPWGEDNATDGVL